MADKQEFFHPLVILPAVAIQLEPQAHYVPRSNHFLVQCMYVKYCIATTLHVSSTMASCPIKVLHEAFSPCTGVQLMDSPCDSHWNAIVGIHRYIKSALSKGLVFEDQGHEQIVGYTN
ncbi:hypothetical protein MTR67_042685 [Solanum verrucosum]|uniref:Uncharacterized protein n=1 Tax=Solanum verrucosum TaxID=315347 RepID=A0AAF0UMU4_SOLVR|nr:hypothetical protein MTR67_042685 [Solanum verrucosum]